MYPLEKLLREHESWLMCRIRDYAVERDYTRYTSTLMEAWRVSIVGLTDSISAALAISEQPWELGPDDNFSTDPVAAFGVLEARKHRSRGVTLEMFMGLMKYYRLAYLDLINLPISPDKEDVSEDTTHFALFVERVFDRIEIAFCAEWSRSETVNSAVYELQAANRQMTNEKNRFLTIFESLPIAVFVLDAQGRIEHMNLAGAQMIDHSVNSGSHYYSPPEERIPFPWLMDELSRFRESEAEQEYECRITLADGNECWVWTRLSSMQDISFKFAGTMIVFKNITERKLVEENFRKQAQFALLRANIGTALGQNRDLRTILQWCSELLVQYLGVSFFRIWTLNEAEQILEMQASAGLYTHINGPHGRVPVGGLKIGLIASERLPHLTNDVLNDPRIGDREWARREGMVAFAGYPLIIADRLVGVMGTFGRTIFKEDLLEELGSVASRIAQCIERKWFEEELRFKNIILVTQQECAIDGILVVDGNGGIISCNRRFVDICNIPPELRETGIEEPVLQFVAQQTHDTEGFLARVRYLYEHRDEKSNEKIYLKDGRILELYSAPMTGFFEKYYGRVWYFHDITEVKRLSEEINQINNLESIGLLVGGLSHDFNNVLNIIYGNITYIKMLAGDESAFVEPLTDAETACERAKELGIRLQGFSQVSTPVKERLSLPDIIEDVATTLLKDSNISRSISATDDLFPVDADPRQIRQIFDNLLTNAKEAMPDGGAVKITVENCAADSHGGIPIGSGHYVRIAVQDNGKGILKENLAKIFNPYFSTKDSYSQRGMGLGLPTCHAILQRHGGHISMESQPDIGTTVTMYLPATVDRTPTTSNE